MTETKVEIPVEALVSEEKKPEQVAEPKGVTEKPKKENKSKGKKQQQQQSKDESNIYTMVVTKKIRALNKRVKNIETIEKKMKNNEEVNADQKDAIAKKDEVLLILSEMEEIEKKLTQEYHEHHVSELNKIKEESEKGSMCLVELFRVTELIAIDDNNRATALAVGDITVDTLDMIFAFKKSLLMDTGRMNAFKRKSSDTAVDGKTFAEIAAIVESISSVFVPSAAPSRGENSKKPRGSRKKNKGKATATASATASSVPKEEVDQVQEKNESKKEEEKKAKEIDVITPPKEVEVVKEAPTPGSVPPKEESHDENKDAMLVDAAIASVVEEKKQPEPVVGKKEDENKEADAATPTPTPTPTETTPVEKPFQHGTRGGSRRGGYRGSRGGQRGGSGGYRGGPARGGRGGFRGVNMHRGGGNRQRNGPPANNNPSE